MQEKNSIKSQKEYQKRLDQEYKLGINYFKKTKNNDIEISEEQYNNKQKTEI